MNVVAWEANRLPAFVEYWKSSFSDARNYLSASEDLFNMRIFERKDALEPFHPSNFLLAIEGSRVVGVIQVGIHTEPFCAAVFPDWEGGTLGYVGFVHVHPEFRRKGIGTALWKAGMERIASAGKMSVDGQCLNPFWGNSESPFVPFWGTPEGISIASDDEGSLEFLKGFRH